MHTYVHGMKCTDEERKSILREGIALYCTFGSFLCTDLTVHAHGNVYKRFVFAKTYV